MQSGSFAGDGLYRELAEFADEALLASDRGTICFANVAACRLLGAPELGELVERPLNTIFDESACAQLFAPDAKNAPFPTTLRRLDGTNLAARVHAKTRDAENQRTTLSLSPLAQAAANLDASWVLEAMPAGVVAIDRTGTIRLVNSALERMFGRARTELFGRAVEELLPERFRGGHVSLRADYWRDPTPRAMGQGRELFALRADGTEFPIEIGLNPIHTPDGVWVLAAVVEVTARKAMETAFKTLVDAAPYGMIMANAQGEIVLVNGTTESLLGYGRDELLGRPLEMLLPERYRAEHSSHRAAFRASPSPRIMGSGRDLTALHKNGLEVPVEIGLTPIWWNEEFMIVAAITDISVRKKMEIDLRQANQHLEEFTYVASHDLKSPLRGISSLIEWIAEDLDETERKKVQHNLTRTSDRIARMERLIDDMLKFARAGRVTTDLETTDPAAVIANILDMHLPPNGIEVFVRSEVAPFVAAKTPIETVLRNLISNAFKHHGGERGRVEITAENENSYCVFTVADDGVGIPGQARDRVFRMFQTVSTSERQGSGLGLSISKRLVEAHGGRIALLPGEQGQGSVFRVWWPRFLRKEIDDRE